MIKSKYKPLAGIEKVYSYVVLFFSALFSFILFGVFNRIHLHGWSNFRRKPGTLLLPNHRTMIDSFLVACFSCFPWALLKPSLAPYHPAAAENFFRGSVLAWFSRMWRCIPIKPGRIDPTALRVIEELLPQGIVMVFPEGTRSRSGKVGKGRIGVGRLILDTDPQVVPVYVAGMEKVLPIGAKFPRIFRRLDIYFGKPLDFSNLMSGPRDRRAAQQAVDTVMGELRIMEKIHAANSAMPWTQKLRGRFLGFWMLMLGLIKTAVALPREIIRILLFGKL